MITEGWSYYDLERPDHYDLIDNDPLLFFRENSNNTIIDEAQKFPQLFSVLRGIVDENRNQNGRYILTGSSSFELLKNISESLAGRVALVELSPFKMSELYAKPLSPFYNIFETKLSLTDLAQLKQLKPVVSFQQIKQSMLKSGYPQPALCKDEKLIRSWMENYFDTLHQPRHARSIS